MSPSSSSARTEKPVARLYAIDWLRVSVMGVVYLFHVLRIFDTDPSSAIKNAQTSVLASVYTFFANQWQMAAFFLLAGASTRFSLRSRTARHYLGERVKRLLVPLVFGSVVLVPWYAYLSALNRGSFRGSWLAYLPLHFPRIWLIIKTTPEYHHGMAVLFAVSWHLWFLGYLFVFSAAALPLLSRGLEGPRSLLVQRLAAFSVRPWGLALLGAPIVVIRMALNARFPAYLDWSDALAWFAVFLFGWLLLADPRFLSAVQAQAGAWLVAGCAGFASLLATHLGGYLQRWLDQPAYTWDYLLFQFLCGVHTWAWLIGITGMTLRRLNFTNPWLDYAGEAVLPFYIIHYVVILTIASFVVQWQVAIFWKFLVIGSTSFVVTSAIYELMVRRNPLLRTLLGMKPVRPKSLP